VDSPVQVYTQRAFMGSTREVHFFPEVTSPEDKVGCECPECLTGETVGVEKGALACAKVAELADAQASGACARKGVGVRVPPFARLTVKAV
jgi:hypothetical protein